MKNWNLNPQTGDYVMTGGAPTNTESLTIPAYFRLKTQRNRWMYSPDTSFGSDFYQFRKQPQAVAVEDAAARALKPMIDDGRASEIQVTAIKEQRGAIVLSTKIIDAAGNPETIEFKPIGV